MTSWRCFLPLLLTLLAPPAALGDDLLSAADRALYGRAFALAAEGRDEAALELARHGEDRLPAKILAWRALTREKAEVDFATVARFLTENPDWPGRLALRRTAERNLPRDMTPGAVIAWFEQNPPASGLGVLHQGTALLAAGREDEARRLARQAWVEQDFTADEEVHFRRRLGRFLSRDDDLARLERLIAQRSRDAARRQAARLGPGYPELADARLRLATMSRGVDSAINRVPRELADHPGLAYERALWRLRKGRHAEAFELVDPPLAGADDERWWTLRHWAARWSLERRDFGRAYRFASAHGQDQGLAFAEGEFLAGWIALRRLSDPALAQRHFQRLHDGVSTPISLARGAYWSGEAAQALGQEESARHWYAVAGHRDLAFYGLLARYRLGVEPPAPPSEPPPTVEERSAFAEREVARALRVLVELEAEDLIPEFFAALRSGASSREDWHLLADFARALGRPEQALKTAKEAARRGILLRQHLFPRPYDLGGGERAALLLAIMRQESEFDPGAVSPAGARGLMQLLPATAKTVAKRLGKRYHRDLLTEDPHYNILLGETYFSELLQRYEGYAPLAIAAYNAGPSRANSWIAAFGDPRSDAVDPVDWIEQIPFEETRNYVQRVLEGAAIYGAPPERAPALLARLLGLGPQQQAFNEEP